MVNYFIFSLVLFVNTQFSLWLPMYLFLNNLSIYPFIYLSISKKCAFVSLESSKHVGFLVSYLIVRISSKPLLNSFLFDFVFTIHRKPDAILGDPGADSGGEGKSKRAGKYGTKKSKERLEEPLGTMSYQTSSK